MISFLVSISNGAVCALLVFCGIWLARRPIADMRNPAHRWRVGPIARGYTASWEAFLRYRAKRSQSEGVR